MLDIIYIQLFADIGEACIEVYILLFDLNPTFNVCFTLVETNIDLEQGLWNGSDRKLTQKAQGRLLFFQVTFP